MAPPSSATPRRPRADGPWYRRLRWRRVLGITAIGGAVHARRLPLRAQHLQPHRAGRGQRVAHRRRERDQLPDRGVRPRANVTEGATPGSTAPRHRAAAGRHDHAAAPRDGKARCCRSPATCTSPSPATAAARRSTPPTRGPTQLVDTVTQSLGIRSTATGGRLRQLRRLVDGLGGITSTSRTRPPTRARMNSPSRARSS